MCVYVCASPGVLFYYILLQLTLWWFLHIFMLFWKIHFPLHASSFRPRMKYIHIAMVSVALLLPTIPSITAAAIGGYNMARIPPFVCIGTSANATFYSLVLPILLLSQGGIIMLIVIFWSIHKVRVDEVNSLSCFSDIHQILLVHLLYMCKAAPHTSEYIVSTTKMTQTRQT